MWTEIRTAGEPYPSAVLSTLDDQGFPTSGRVTPSYDDSTQSIRITLPVSTEMRPGPASLLFHHHDEDLWDLTSHLVRGVVEREEDAWLLRPKQLTVGGARGTLGTIRLILQSRRRARTYLARHGIHDAQVKWDEIRALQRQAAD